MGITIYNHLRVPVCLAVCLPPLSDCLIVTSQDGWMGSRRGTETVADAPSIVISFSLAPGLLSPNHAAMAFPMYLHKKCWMMQTHSLPHTRWLAFDGSAEDDLHPSVSPIQRAIETLRFLLLITRMDLIQLLANWYFIKVRI